mmetsp:Transcript_96460/g.269938  ORF Transcript_96460/g.269938 Transcript_96460/m.269938 type:complete len:236 (-) Transcript_96460:35-742(-)
MFAIAATSACNFILGSSPEVATSFTRPKSMLTALATAAISSRNSPTCDMLASRAWECSSRCCCIAALADSISWTCRSCNARSAVCCARKSRSASSVRPASSPRAAAASATARSCCCMSRKSSRSWRIADSVSATCRFSSCVAFSCASTARTDDIKGPSSSRLSARTPWSSASKRRWASCISRTRASHSTTTRAEPRASASSALLSSRCCCNNCCNCARSSKASATRERSRSSRAA